MSFCASKMGVEFVEFAFAGFKFTRFWLEFVFVGSALAKVVIEFALTEFKFARFWLEFVLILRLEREFLSLSLSLSLSRLPAHQCLERLKPPRLAYLPHLWQCLPLWMTNLAHQPRLCLRNLPNL